MHVATSALSLAGQLNDMPPVLGAAQRARLEELITRDHRYHEARRRPRPARRLTALPAAARSSNRSLGEIGIEVIGMPSASSIADGEHRRARDHARLAGALDPERVERRRRLQVVDLDARAGTSLT